MTYRVGLSETSVWHPVSVVHLRRKTLTPTPFQRSSAGVADVSPFSSRPFSGLRRITSISLRNPCLLSIARTRKIPGDFQYIRSPTVTCQCLRFRRRLRNNGKKQMRRIAAVAEDFVRDGTAATDMVG